jgi:hypothetical protein
MNRLALTILALGCALAAPVLADPYPSPAPTRIGQVFKSPTCDCCSKWVAHMAANGFQLREMDMPTQDLNLLKQRLGLTRAQASCHTAMIGPYVIEGHVPADDVIRLLNDAPDPLGLSVPGMPIGSPGMEVGDQKEPYDVLLMKKDGTTDVFARH